MRSSAPQLRYEVRAALLRTPNSELTFDRSLERYGLSLHEPETASETAQSSPQRAGSSPETETEITEREAEMFRVLSELGHTQTEIIKAVWNTKPGASKDYQKALVKYKLLEAQKQQEKKRVRISLPECERDRATCGKFWKSRQF